MTASARSAGSRLGLTLTTLGLAAGVLAGGSAIEGLLANGQDIDLGLMELRLAYNHGVGFSLGADLPTWTVLAVTSGVTLAVAIYAWITAPTAGLLTRAAMAAILAGALSNVFDRMADGHVTDYLHTGWFPTFNLADILVSTGAALFVISTARDPGSIEEDTNTGESSNAAEEAAKTEDSVGQ